MNKDVLKWTVEITKASVEAGKNCHGDEVSGFMRRVFETLAELSERTEISKPAKEEKTKKETKNENDND
ncbi:MAG: hypothetical protein FWE33_03390 [Defluviitaleaceae bacterium]|nr:hypothetical protein [Defluviitaleaceae bacterium]